jgi:hypothetical protein
MRATRAHYPLQHIHIQVLMEFIAQIFLITLKQRLNLFIRDKI